MANYSVVVIEDNDPDVDIVSDSLSPDTYTLSVFADGLAAWAHLEDNSESVDIVILGKTIPNIDGMEILAKMQSNDKLKKVPVIIQTVDDRRGKQYEALEEGAYFYLTKPVDTRKLVRLVKAAIRTKDTVIPSMQIQNGGRPTSFVDSVTSGWA